VAVAGEERALRGRSGDPVDAEAEGALEAAHRPLRPAAEVAVQVRRREAAVREEELEDGHVPADPAARQRSHAEERPPEPSELRARPRPSKAIGMDALPVLEGAHGARRPATDDPVDRADLVAVRPKRDLEARDLWVRVRRRRAGQGCGDEERNEDEPASHRDLPSWPVAADFLPVEGWQLAAPAPMHRIRDRMPYELTDPRDRETGFGTGLRRQLERRLTPGDEPQPEAKAEPEPTAEERSEVDELWAELKAAGKREAGLRRVVAEHEKLQVRAADLEQALAVREAELSALRILLDEETRPREQESARRYLRRQAEAHADLLWRAFEDGLTALRSDGTVDARLRLEAARSLLAEAYPESAPPDRSATDAQDDLADLRARRAFNQPS
jgi:hypothetical protein